MTKVTEFRGQSDDELQAAIGTLKKEQFNLRFQKASGQLEATGRVQVVRRDIARIKTLQGERSRAASQSK
jgi:large subunit ribosomal protein L29